MNTLYNRFVIVLFLTMPAICIKAHNAPFRINGISPYYDSLTNSYLMSVDEKVWNHNWNASISLSDDSSWNSFTIDGTPVSESYTFTDVCGEKSYELIAESDGKQDTCTLHFTFLPIIYLGNANLGYNYVTSSFALQHQGKQEESVMAEVKWRGGTTNSAGKNKRNYKVKLVDNQGSKLEKSFLGLRKDNVWILDAGQVDMFRMRNLIACQIWQDFASKPYYYDREPKVMSATRGQMVEVFLGNKYQGIFNMCEPIDRKEMKLKKFDDDGTIHGGLWKATGFGDATFWNVPDAYDNTKEQNDVWELKYPKIDDLCPSDYATLWNAIMFVATSSDAEFNAHVAEYFDMPVLIDYYLFVQLTNGFDICGKNVYWAVYDKQTDKKLTPAMWDLDCTMGQNYKDDPLRPDYVAPENPLYTPNKIFYRLANLNTDNFNDKIKQRYAVLRDGVFDPDALKRRYADVYSALQASGAVAREERRWSYDTDISGLQLNFEEELDYICDWIDRRIQFLDTQFAFTPPTAIQSVQYTQKPADGKVYTLQGTIVQKSYKGVVISNGRLEVRY